MKEKAAASHAETTSLKVTAPDEGQSAGTAGQIDHLLKDALRRPRRVCDEALTAFDQACDQDDLEAAELI